MIYPQRCPACDHRFDHERPIAEYALDPPCPECGTASPQDYQAKRYPLVFKGDGFYANRPRTVVTEPRDGRPREVDLRPGQRSC